MITVATAPNLPAALPAALTVIVVKKKGWRRKNCIQCSCPKKTEKKNKLQFCYI